MLDRLLKNKLKQDVMSGKPINIFWTGGFDSTFRVLHLLVAEKKYVQPFFIVRAQESVGYEINTMVDIRRVLFRKFPEAQNLLLPTKYIDILEINEYSEITEAYKRIKRECHIAQQFEFLAFFCKDWGINDMELSIEEDGNKESRIYSFISAAVTKSSDYSSSLTKEVCDTPFGKDLFELFKYYSFPIIHTSRADMIRIAKELNYEELLAMTWSCATPFRGKPCGFCNPCLHTIKTKRPNGVPVFRKIVSNLHLPFRKFYRKYKSSYS